MKLRISFKFIAVLLALANFLPNQGNVRAQTTEPRIQSGDLEYLGAFRLPRGENGDPNGFSYGGGPIAYYAKNDSLFVATRHSGIAEVKIPTPAIKSDIEELPFATIIQSINPDPTEGGLSVLPQSSIRGLIVDGEKIYGTGSIYYDASNSARVSHFSRSTDLSKASATSFKALWQAEKSGFVGGWLAKVPAEWQSILGGGIISGNCCVPIVSRTSFGPSAFAWNPDDFGKDLIPATPLLYYSGEHPTLGEWGSSNPIYGGTTTIGGMVIPDGTNSLLYFGMNGIGEFCYGTGGASGGECIDPLSSSKGQHAYPYNHQVWAYDLNDLAEVKKGNKNPWDVKPYSVWKLEFPNSFISTYGIGGVTYDANKQLIYLSQLQADTDGYSSRAIIHVFKVNAGTAVSPTNTPTSTSPPAKTSVTTGRIRERSSNRPKPTPALAQPHPVMPAVTLAINRNLFMGMRGADVVTLQNYLIQKGYLRVSATGYFGPLTHAAVRAFQRDKGLPQTGFFGPLSRGVLNI